MKIFILERERYAIIYFIKLQEAQKASTKTTTKFIRSPNECHRMNEKKSLGRIKPRIKLMKKSSQ